MFGALGPKIGGGGVVVDYGRDADQVLSVTWEFGGLSVGAVGWHFEAVICADVEMMHDGVSGGLLEAGVEEGGGVGIER